MSDLQVRPGSRQRIVVALTGLVGAALVVLAVLAFLDRDSGEGGGPLQPVPGPDPGMGSVYAVEIDPRDGGVLYAGTRFGLFRITEDGEAVRVANRHQETHALAVLGPDHLLASGHPDPREDLPAKLGLIESTDGGMTWEPVSLAGLADFHILSARHGLVYGYDSSTQRLLVTEDREQWDRRAELPLLSVAVSPSDEAVLLAVTDKYALKRSTDGGRTFTSAGPVPELAALTWPSRDKVLAVGVDGRVYGSIDAGTTWSVLGRVDGLPQAIVATNSSSLYVATDTGIYASTDGGQTFTVRYREE